MFLDLPRDAAELLHAYTRLVFVSSFARGAETIVEVLRAPRSGRSSLIVCGGSSTKAYALRLKEALSAVGYAATVAQCEAADKKSLHRLAAVARSTRARSVIGVGGGKVVDLAKVVAATFGLPMLAYPTALSTDGVCSPGSSILTDGFSPLRTSCPVAPPVAVIVDTRMTARAPQYLSVSGTCDVLSNASALLDFSAADGEPRSLAVEQASRLAQMSYELVLDARLRDIRCETYQRTLATALMLSGLSMYVAGSSAPCSGAEHLISHSFDHLKVSRSSHGCQVGAATLFCHHLRRCVGLMGLPHSVQAVLEVEFFDSVCPSSLGLGKAAFLRAVQLATTLRPERETLLSNDVCRSYFSEAYDRAFGRVFVADGLGVS